MMELYLYSPTSLNGVHNEKFNFTLSPSLSLSVCRPIRARARTHTHTRTGKYAYTLSSYLTQTKVRAHYKNRLIMAV
jgi:hypothetical protein